MLTTRGATRRSPFVLLAGLMVAMSIPLAACKRPPEEPTYDPTSTYIAPPSPNHAIAVPYKSQETDYYCTVASAQMWRAYKGLPTPNTYSPGNQDYMWAWMLGRWGPPWVEDEQGLNDLRPLADAVNWFVFDTDISWQDPVVNVYTYYGDQHSDGPDKAISAQAAAIVHGEPTIATINYNHAVVTYAGFWEKLPTDQPFANYIYYHDPLQGPERYATVDAWRGLIGTVPSQVGFNYAYEATYGLEVFKASAGTYYGDPAPPECEPDPDHCGPPLVTSLPRVLGGLRWLVTNLLQRPSSILARRDTQATVAAPLGVQRVIDGVQLSGLASRRFVKRPLGPGRRPSGPRRYKYVPYPFTTNRPEILANLRAGLDQSGLASRDDIRPLLHDSTLVVSSVRHVDSWQDEPDYYLVHYDDASGRPFALAAVSETGWLLQAARVGPGGDVPREEEVKRVAEAHGGARHGVATLVRTSGQGVGCYDYLSPLAVVEVDGEPIMMLNTKRAVYVPDREGNLLVRSKGGGGLRIRRIDAN